MCKRINYKVLYTLSRKFVLVHLWEVLSFCSFSCCPFLFILALLFRLAENVCFLIGCSYFVAGSYPDEEHVVEVDPETGMPNPQLDV